MKKIISTFIVMMSLSPAAFAKLEPVAKADFPAYKNVAYDQYLHCREFAGIVLENVSEIFVDKSGTQPALLFRRYGINERSELTLYTSPDQQRVTRAVGEFFRLQNVNRGSVVSPKFVKEWVFQGREDCRPNSDR